MPGARDWLRRSAVRAGSLLGVTAVAAGLAVQATWPLAAHLGDVLPGQVFPADQYILAYALEWTWGTLRGEPGGLFDAGICWPASGALAGSEHMLGFLPPYGLLRLAGATPLAALHVLLIASYAACLLAMAALVLAWTRDRSAALLAGALYAFSAYQLSSAAWLHVVATFCLPLLVLGADRLAEGRRGAVTLVAATAFAQVVLGVYGSVLALVTGATFALVRWTAAWQWPSLRAIGCLAAALLPAAAVAVAIAQPYLDVHAEATSAFDPVEALRRRTVGIAWAVDLLDDHAAIARRALLLLGVLRPPAGMLGLQAPMDPGRVTVVLGAVGLACALAGRGTRWRARGLGLLALVVIGVAFGIGAGFVVASGTAVPLPFLWLDGVPVLSGLRVSERFGSVATVGLAAAAGIGFHGLLRRAPAVLRGTACLALLVAARVDAGGVPAIPAIQVPDAERVVGAMRAAAAFGPVAEYPLVGLTNEAHARLLLSAAHRRRTTLCVTGHRPGRWHAAIARLGNAARPLGARLDEAGIRAILVWKPELAASQVDALRAIASPVWETDAVLLLERRPDPPPPTVPPLEPAGAPQAAARPRELPPLAVHVAGPLVARRWTQVRVDVHNPRDVLWPPPEEGAPARVTLRWRAADGTPVVRTLTDPVRRARLQALPPAWRDRVAAMYDKPVTLDVGEPVAPGGVRAMSASLPAPPAGWYLIEATLERPRRLDDAPVTAVTPVEVKRPKTAPAQP